MKPKSWYPNLGGLRKQILKDFGAWSPASQMAMHTSLCVIIYIKTYSVIWCNCAICQIFTNNELRYTPVEGKALMGAITDWEAQSVNQFSHFVVPDSLWHHGLHYARLPCASPTSGVCSDSCSSSQWWTIQPSHPLSSPSLPTFNLSQHQGLF